MHTKELAIAAYIQRGYASPILYLSFVFNYSRLYHLLDTQHLMSVILKRVCFVCLQPTVKSWLSGPNKML